MYKRIFSIVIILFVIASILTVSTASDYSKENLVSYDDASKEIEVLQVSNKDNKENDINKEDISKINNNKDKKEEKEVSKTTKDNLDSNTKENKKITPNSNSELKAKPRSEDKAKPVHKLKTEVKSELKPESKPKPEPKPQAKPEPKPQAKPEPKPQAKPESKPEPKPEPKPQTPVSSSRQYEKEVIRLVNIERQKHGLNKLTESRKLANVARYKSQDMINKNYFSHESPTYGSPFNMMKKFGISYNAAGENIAAGQHTPKDVVNAWMNSQGHRANILSSKFNQIGIGFIKDKNNYPFWTQMFIGTR